MSLDERVDDRTTRLRAAFQGELLRVVDRLAKAAAAEADAAKESARAAGQTALDAAFSELEQRTRQCGDLTESVRQLETRIEELRSALDMEHSRSDDLKRQLEAQVAERARLLTAFKQVQHACALAETNSEAFDAARLRAEEQPADAGANDPSPGESMRRDVGASAGADSKAGRKPTFVERPAVEVPPTLAEYSKQLFPRETPRAGASSDVKTEGRTAPPRPPRRYL